MKTKAILLFVLILSIYSCAEEDSGAVKSFKEWVEIGNGVWDKYQEFLLLDKDKAGENLVAWLKTQEWVAYAYSDEYVIFYQDYQNRQAGITIKEEGTDEGTITGELEFFVNNSLNDNNTTTKHYLKNRKVLVLIGLSHEQYTQPEEGQPVSIEESVDMLVEKFKKYGFEVDKREVSKIKDLYNDFDKYSIIVIVIHGGRVNGHWTPDEGKPGCILVEEGNEEKGYLCLDSIRNTVDAGFDITPDDLEEENIMQEEALVPNKYRWTDMIVNWMKEGVSSVRFFPYFFVKKLPTELDNIIFFESCHSGIMDQREGVKTNHLAKAFLDKGAISYFGPIKASKIEHLVNKTHSLLTNMFEFDSNDDPKSDLDAMKNMGAANDFPDDSYVPYKEAEIYGIPLSYPENNTNFWVRYAKDEIYINSDIEVTIKNIPKDTNGLKIYIYKPNTENTEDLDEDVPVNPFILIKDISDLTEKKVTIEKVPLGKKKIRVEAYNGNKITKAQTICTVKCKAENNNCTVDLSPEKEYRISGSEDPSSEYCRDDQLIVWLNEESIYENHKVVYNDDCSSSFSFYAHNDDILRIQAIDTGGYVILLSPLYLHCEGEYKLLTEGVPSTGIPPEPQGVFFEGIYRLKPPPELFETIQETK